MLFSCIRFFCLVHNVRTGRIIRRGTEQEGPYYVNEVIQQGSSILAHGVIERELLLWHRRLGDPPQGIWID